MKFRKLSKNRDSKIDTIYQNFIVEFDKRNNYKTKFCISLCQEFILKSICVTLSSPTHMSNPPCFLNCNKHAILLLLQNFNTFIKFHRSKFDTPHLCIPGFFNVISYKNSILVHEYKSYEST